MEVILSGVVEGVYNDDVVFDFIGTFFFLNVTTTTTHIYLIFMLTDDN